MRPYTKRVEEKKEDQRPLNQEAQFEMKNEIERLVLGSFDVEEVVLVGRPSTQDHALSRSQVPRDAAPDKHSVFHARKSPNTISLASSICLPASLHSGLCAYSPSILLLYAFDDLTT
jgi:hypothetical protein